MVLGVVLLRSSGARSILPLKRSNDGALLVSDDGCVDGESRLGFLSHIGRRGVNSILGDINDVVSIALRSAAIACWAASQITAAIVIRIRMTEVSPGGFNKRLRLRRRNWATSGHKQVQFGFTTNHLQGYRRVMIKKILPKPAKILARKAIKFFKYRYRQIAIRVPVKQQRPMRIILGAAETHQPGWFSTNENWLDITNATHWQRVFKGQQLITHAVAEHVFEHLTYDEAARALQHLHQHMAKDGRVRIAVPDGYNPDPTYIRHVGINGIGDDAADHKQLLNTDVLCDLLQKNGFAATHIEGYTRDGQLIQKTYSPDDGFIMRSRANPKLKDRKHWDFVDAETSLIVDGRKL